jgi:hypothetical protein
LGLFLWRLIVNKTEQKIRQSLKEIEKLLKGNKSKIYINGRFYVFEKK